MRDPDAAVVLVVRDIEAATRWYRYVFNLHVESERPGINGLPIETSLRRHGGPNLVLLLARLAPSELPRQTVLRLILPDNLDRLAERAALIEESAVAPAFERGEFGRQLVLHDPDGHTLVLLNAGPGTLAR
jgi:catechol 2,3-dioxygenase-like lactoylglutathione lyase family enzyme